MGIDAAFFERIAAIGREQSLFPGASIAILGDCRFHTQWATGDNRADLARFAQELGLARVETLDVMGAPTITLDLHEPLPDVLGGQFDIVVDAGTVHCCFDVAAVLKNCLALLKQHGSIFHLSALTGYFGRAYYCFNPLLFRDFYLQNGFEILAMESRVPATGQGISPWLRRLHRLVGRRLGTFTPIRPQELCLVDADAFSLRFGPTLSHKTILLPNDAVLMVAARREQALPFVRPMPSFFSGSAGGDLL